jgi:hypothetical protein
MRPDPALRFWEGDTNPNGPGLTLVRLGGHFAGGAVVHWAAWEQGRGALLCGDILQVVPSGHVSFMWSYTNLIPLSAATVLRMAKILGPFAFRRRLWHVFRPGPDRRKRQASGCGVGCPLHRTGQRDVVEERNMRI